MSSPAKKKVRYMINEKDLIQYEVKKKLLKLDETTRNLETLLLILYNNENLKNKIIDERHNDLNKLFKSFKNFEEDVKYFKEKFNK